MEQGLEAGTPQITTDVAGSSVSLISNTIQVFGITTIEPALALGQPIMREGFITETGLLQQTHR